MKNLNVFFGLILLSQISFAKDTNTIAKEYKKAAAAHSESKLLVRSAKAAKFTANKDLKPGHVEMEVMYEPDCFNNKCLTFTYIMDDQTVCFVTISNLGESNDNATCYDRVR